MWMQFYAVTGTSLYLVSDKRDKKGVPLVRKKALKGESKIPVGYRFKKGSHLGVTRYGLISYLMEHKDLPLILPVEKINTAYTYEKTCQIVALFMRENEAQDCFNSKNLQICDPRWRKQTEEVLEALKGNQVIIVSQGPEWVFVYS